MPRTLYARLATMLALLLMAIGLVYGVLSFSATRHYLLEVSQRFNRELARNLVADRNLVQEGKIDQDALKETFHHYMVINPSIEIYLLDLDGTILAFSADPGKVKRRRVSLEPIGAFLAGDVRYPLLGDDPRSHERRKAFSVTPVPTAERPEGYLYVILRGEEFDSVDKAIQESYFLRFSAWAVGASLLLGLVAGLMVLRLLTRRLDTLAAAMDGFRTSNFTAPVRYQGSAGASQDEIDRLAVTFKEMASRIAAQLEALNEKDAMRRDLVAQVSHDLRTPLASLQGYLETLHMKDEDLTARQRDQYLTTALRHGERLRRLIEDLFELAKLDAREIELHAEAFSVPELAQDVVQKFELMAQRKRLRLKVERTDEPYFALADIGLIERVMDNLLENAVDHTPEGGQVRIVLQGRDEQVLVRVTDTGCGISKTELPRIFDQFFQGQNQHRGEQHAGLGLAIAKRILELHGADIDVSSEQGVGTTFTFSLRAAHACTRAAPVAECST